MYLMYRFIFHAFLCPKIYHGDKLIVYSQYLDQFGLREEMQTVDLDSPGCGFTLSWVGKAWESRKLSCLRARKSKKNIRAKPLLPWWNLYRRITSLSNFYFFPTSGFCKVPSHLRTHQCREPNRHSKLSHKNWTKNGQIQTKKHMWNKSSFRNTWGKHTFNRSSIDNGQTKPKTGTLPCSLLNSHGWHSSTCCRNISTSHFGLKQGSTILCFTPQKLQLT